MRAKPALLLLMMLILPVLACNYPGISRGADTNKKVELRETLQAIPLNTETFPPEQLPLTVIPGSTLTTIPTFDSQTFDGSSHTAAWFL